MNNGSEINKMLTLEYICSEDENKYFDRKSAKIKVSDLAPLISAFANADGGTIVIGVSDKDRTLEGINHCAQDKINDFINAPRDCCKPMPRYQEEYIDIINKSGAKDRILLLHIFASVDQLIRTTKDSTYLRIGDRTKEMLGENLKNLEYTKSTRHYEDEINTDAELFDLDEGLIEEYKDKIGANEMDSFDVLKARGFIKKKNGKDYLTNAAILLFAKNIVQFYPNCRIRFIRYDGIFANVGTDINIIRDYSVELPILRIIEKTKDFISTQLREFTALNGTTGQFQIVPEYPEFAWLEGIVNAVAHREYAMTGSYIKVSMYDDRLEIESPGKLPNIVTIDNIRETRYSRNPRISRVLTEFGWVRELNEGVKRIYSDMEKFFLEDPVYSEPEQAVRLVLKNNIVMRTMRQKDRTLDSIGKEMWNQLDNIEREILTYIAGNGQASRDDLVKFTGKSGSTITRRLRNLCEREIVALNGNKNDPGLRYVIVNKMTKFD
ncbi:MAG: putative DNA binding domain-containing protein [Pseudobutyrivibrio sp.]|nr:putative DNA binding domain-containing protein [Pseudobutyrivibrio sp.]